MRLLLLVFLGCMALTGCVSTHSADIVYYSLTPTTVGASVFSENRNASGVNQSCIDTWLIEKNGKCTHIGQATASGQGALPSLLGGFLSSSANTAIVGAAIGATK